jgi:MYXO-CTERM domain-containing protein
MRARIATAFAAAALISTLTARPAGAYVRAINDFGAPFYWPTNTSCAAVTIYLNGFLTMTSDEVAKSIAAAAHAWSPSEVTCPGPNGDAGTGHPYFEIVPSMSTGGPVPEVANDGKNSIIFQTTDWTLDSTIIALTSHFSTPSGEIVDTDIEINAVNPTWANLDPDDGSFGSSHLGDEIDLQTAVTHEFGHFLGLAHTCVHAVFDPPAASVDDQGHPVPECPDPATSGDLPQSQSVMWFFVEPESTTKRVLAPDDVHAVCDLYPAAQDPHLCTLNLPDDGCGCAAAGSQGPRGAALSLLAFGAAVAHARRRRRLRSDRDRRAAL